MHQLSLLELTRVFRRMCRHEAGHYLVAMRLGFEGASITVEVRQDGAQRGGAELLLARPVVGQDQVVQYLQHRIAVLYAGAIAECSKRGQVDGPALEKALETNAAGDYAKLLELLTLLRNLAHPETTSGDKQSQELMELDTELRTYSSKIVDEVEEAVDELEEALVGRFKPAFPIASMTHVEIRALSSVQRLFG